MLSRRILYFFPHNPYPPKSGAHVRCLEMLKALKELGYEVTLASSALSSETKWTQSSIDMLESNWVSSVRVYQPAKFDVAFRGYLIRFYRSLGKAVPVNSAIYTPPGMRIWFGKLFHSIRPTVLFTSYAHWDGLVHHSLWRSTTRVVDTLDFMSLNIAMRTALAPYLPDEPIRAQDVNDEALQEDFFRQLQLSPDRNETYTFSKYTWAIAISEAEASLIRQEARNTRVVRIPVTQEPRELLNLYNGAAVFPTGPNPFNIQGYCYFVKKVLPKIQKRDASFQLQVTGYICAHVSPENGVSLSGYLPNLQEVYETSRLMICPVFGGTGQQIKIIEAMAHGIPVIALEDAARGSPILHGHNGFIAKDAEEFAEYTLQLWQDQELCHRLGAAARETIAAQCSTESLCYALSNSILGLASQQIRATTACETKNR